MEKTALEQALDQLDQAVAAVRAAQSSDLAHDGGADAAGDAAHALSGGAIDPFVFRFAIFVLAIFVGYYVVWSVTPALHTPLMAVTNAISSVIVVGALLAVGISASGLAHRLRLRRADARLGQHLRRLPRHPAHAGHVQEEGEVTMNANFASFLYLVSGILFILALRGLSHPTTSRQGNMYGMIGMGIAIVTTLALATPSCGGFGADRARPGRSAARVGAVTARRIAMTSMPQLVAAFHSPGRPGRRDGRGGRDLRARQLRHRHGRRHPQPGAGRDGLGVAIGAITFTGSVIAFLKLDGRMSGKPIMLPMRHVVNIALGHRAGRADHPAGHHRKLRSSSG